MLKQQSVVRVGIADMNIVKDGTTIRTSGLGSCVGVVLYDDYKKIGGMVHIMLPDATADRSAKVNLAKYANTGIIALVDKLEKEGVRAFRLRAKIAGGAQMFQFGTSDTLKIGPRNVEAVRHTLQKYSIPIVGECVGGTKGRTIEFNPATSQLSIRTVNEEPFTI